MFLLIPPFFSTKNINPSGFAFNFIPSLLLLIQIIHNLFRYVKSRSDRQLLHGLGYNDTSPCRPLESSNDLPIVPCGLIAWSLFNDTYKFRRGPSELKVNRKDIAWKSDRDHKFGKQVYPFNFQNGTLTGGAKLDPSIPVSTELLNRILAFVIFSCVTTCFDLKHWHLPFLCPTLTYLTEFL